MSYNKVALEKVIKAIGDEVGNKYSWLIVSIEAQTVGAWKLDGNITMGDMAEKCNEPFGYYEVEWNALKNFAPRIRGVVDFTLIGCKDKEEYIKRIEMAKANNKAWVDAGLNSDCELRFDIYDGKIWEINGRDTALVERLKNFFHRFLFY